MEQGADIYENQDIPVNAAAIDYVFVTHAHIDHSGLLPLLYARGFRGQIFATNATTQLCNIMLKDSAHIQEFEADWRNRKARRAGQPEVVPMYSMNDAQGVLNYFVPCDYDKKVHVCDELTVCFRDAGHLLGSSFIEMWAKEEEDECKLIFSGDIGNGNRALIRDPEIPESADYLIMESTYGDRNHEVPPDYASELARVLAVTFARGGNVVIPAFSVGRTQEMLYFIREIKEKNLLPDYPNFEVYVDSPLAIEATNVFNKNVKSCFDEDALAIIEKGINPLVFPGLKTTITSDESRMINFDTKPKVILSASGMCEAGRIRHHLKHNLWKKESTICFVGYQAVGTLGRKLIEGAECVKLFGETVEVNAKIESLKGISGHADRNGLLDWLSGFENTPQHVFVVHGEDQVTDTFAEAITEKFGWPAMAPYSGGCVDLATGEILSVGIKEPKKAVEKPAQIRKQNAFYRVVAAAKRLLDVVYKNEGLANKELMKFENQINNLADKWDR